MQINKETIYTLKLTQEELDNLVADIHVAARNAVLNDSTEYFYSQIVDFKS